MCSNVFQWFHSLLHHPVGILPPVLTTPMLVIPWGVGA